MCSAYTHQAACKKAREMGASISEVNDWTWASGFPSAETAWHFQTEFNGMESAGAYPDKSGKTFSVCFR